MKKNSSWAVRAGLAAGTILPVGEVVAAPSAPSPSAVTTDAPGAVGSQEPPPPQNLAVAVGIPAAMLAGGAGAWVTAGAGEKKKSKKENAPRR